MRARHDAGYDRARIPEKPNPMPPPTPLSSCVPCNAPTQTPSLSDRSPPAGIASSLSQWFADEVQSHEPVLRSYLHSTFPKVRDVDDVVQESYLRVWRAHASDPLRSAKAFLFTVARRLALDWLRHEKRSPINAVGNPAELSVLDERPGVAELVSSREKVEILSDALLTLPPRCRTVVMLYKFKGKSRVEVARQLGIAEKTVDEQAARGVRRLVAYFRARGIDRLFDA